MRHQRYPALKPSLRSRGVERSVALCSSLLRSGTIGCCRAGLGFSIRTATLAARRRSSRAVGFAHLLRPVRGLPKFSKRGLSCRSGVTLSQQLEPPATRPRNVRPENTWLCRNDGSQVVEFGG